MQQNLDLDIADENTITLHYLQSIDLGEPTALQTAVSTLNYRDIFSTLSQLRNELFQDLVNKPEAQHEVIFKAYRSELQATCDDAQKLESIFGQTNPDIAEKAHAIIALLEAELAVISSFEAQKLRTTLVSALHKVVSSAKKLCEKVKN